MLSADESAPAEEAVDANTPADEPPDSSDPSRGRWTAERAAVAAFAVLLAVAFFVLAWFGRKQWFRQDDWGVLTRNLGSVDGLFRPQNEHWSTFPLIVYHVLYWAFGLHYRAYQICTIALHLTVVALLRVIMRRAGVGPWFATIVAGVFVFFGSGRDNILLAIQISMVGSVVFGICQLLCADRDGRFNRRDAAGLGFGALGILASGVGPIMVIIVGISVFFRRGWRMAALHTAPLAAMYGLWYEAERKYMAIPSPSNPAKYATQWTVSGERAIFVALGHFAVVAVLLGALLVVGLFLAWRKLPLAELRTRAAVPAAMLLGGPVLFTVISTQRYWAGNEAASPRYLAMATAFTLPALAVAAQAVARQWQRFAPLVVVLLLIGVPANVSKLTLGAFFERFFANEKATLSGLAYSPLAEQVPRDLKPHTELLTAPYVDVGFLLDAKRSGRIPPPPKLSLLKQDEIVVRLAVNQKIETPLADVTCRRYPRSLVVHPAKGTVYVLKQPVSISYRPPGGRVAAGAVRYDPGYGRVLVIELPGLELHVVHGIGLHPPKDPSFEFCT